MCSFHGRQKVLALVFANWSMFLRKICAKHMITLKNQFSEFIYRLSRRIGTIGEFGPLIQRIGTTLFKSKLVLFPGLSGSNCPNGKILSDNWNHSVNQLEPPWVHKFSGKMGGHFWNNLVLKLSWKSLQYGVQ